MAFHYPGGGPPSFGRYIELIPIARDVLRLSGVKEGEKLVIYTDTNRDKDHIDAFYAAALTLGAETCVVLTTPRNDPNRRPREPAKKAMAGAAMVMDLTSVSWIYTPDFSELLNSGVRILSCMASTDTMVKETPREDIARRAKAGGAILDKAKVLRAVSEAGSDLALPKEGRMGAWQEGLLSGPGDWDNFPSAQCACAPWEDQAEGTLVLAPGDIMLPLKRIVSTPVRMVIKGGRITSIDGEADAAILRQWFEQWEDPNSYIIAHAGFGCEPRAEIMAMQLMEWESFAGNFMVAFGQNNGKFLGGKTSSRSHIDFVCLGNDFYADDQLLIKKGKFVDPRLQLD